MNLQANLAQSDSLQCVNASHSEIRAQLEKILASPTLQRASRQRQFLRYAVEEMLAGRGNLIKEYSIGAEAFGKGESFDPRLDPIVRTEARKLRARLAKYYEAEGSADLLRIEFPKGSYEPTFKRQSDNQPPELSTSIACTDPLEPAPADADIPLRRTLFSLQAKIAAAVLASLILGTVMWRINRRLPSTRSDEAAIAVLPFVNLSSAADYQFLNVGVTQELTDSLGKIPRLKVIGRESVSELKRNSAASHKLAEKLGIIILEGTVRRSQNRVHVTAQLRTTDGRRLWSGTFDHGLDDLRTINEEMSEAISNVVAARVAGQPEIEVQQHASARVSASTPAAYREYLRGLYYWNKLTPDSLTLAIQSFERAIADDPSFARAYVALAHSYAVTPQVTTAPPKGVLARIRSLALKALDLDKTLGEAHIDLAICAEYEFDWATARKQFEKGLELSPNSALGHLWYAKYLAITGRKQEVMAQRRLAADLDPVSPYAFQSVAGCLSVMGRYDDAIDEFQKALALEPNFGLTHQGLGIAYLLKGAHEKAISELEIANNLMSGPKRKALLGYALGVSGRTAEASRILQEFLMEADRGPFPALAVAEIYIGLGDKDQAFKWLERAVEQRDLDATLQWDSLYEPLRSDPRYAGLLHRMKLS